MTSSVTVHVADVASDGVQKCMRCGEILVDNRGVQQLRGSPGPKFFVCGTSVELYIASRMRGVSITTSAPTCELKETKSERDKGNEAGGS